MGRVPKPSLTCYRCGMPIPDDEKAVKVDVGTGWQHFECGERDPKTGKRAKT